VSGAADHPRIATIGASAADRRAIAALADDLAAWFGGAPEGSLGTLARVLVQVAAPDLAPVRALCAERPEIAHEASVRAADTLWIAMREARRVGGEERARADAIGRALGDGERGGAASAGPPRPSAGAPGARPEPPRPDPGAGVARAGRGSDGSGEAARRFDEPPAEVEGGRGLEGRDVEGSGAPWWPGDEPGAPYPVRGRERRMDAPSSREVSDGDGSAARPGPEPGAPPEAPGRDPGAAPASGRGRRDGAGSTAPMAGEASRPGGEAGGPAAAPGQERRVEPGEDPDPGAPDGGDAPAADGPTPALTADAADGDPEGGFAGEDLASAAPAAPTADGPSNVDPDGRPPAAPSRPTADATQSVGSDRGPASEDPGATASPEETDDADLGPAASPPDVGSSPERGAGADDRGPGAVLLGMTPGPSEAPALAPSEVTGLVDALRGIGGGRFVVGVARAAADGASDVVAALAAVQRLAPGAGWSLGPGALRRIAVGDLPRLARLLSRLPRLVALVDALGRAEAQAAKDGGERGGSEEVVGVAASGDVTRALPSELALLADPATEDLFFARYAERRLISLQLAGRGLDGVAAPAERGPVIACVDASASMDGEPEWAAKAIVLAVVRRAMAQRRDVHLLVFGGRGQHLERRLRAGASGVEGLLDLLASSFDGGTDFDGPLLRALALLDDPRLARADLLVVTDGHAAASPATVRAIADARRDTGARVVSIVVGNPHVDGVRPFSDEVLRAPAALESAIGAGFQALRGTGASVRVRG
jgi:Mg-chelatase subunit ChlD